MLYGFIDMLLRILPRIDGHLGIGSQASNLHRDLVGVRGYVVGGYQQRRLDRPTDITEGEGHNWIIRQSCRWPLMTRACLATERGAMYPLDESLAISTELSMLPLMERVLSRRGILKA